MATRKKKAMTSGADPQTALVNSLKRIELQTDAHQKLAVTTIVDPTGFRLGVAVLNEPGFTPFKPDSPNGKLRFKTLEDAQAKADELNEAKGLSKERATEIMLSTVGAQLENERDVRVYEVVVRLRVGRFDGEATPLSIRERLQEAIEINDHVIKVDSIEVTPA